MALEHESACTSNHVIFCNLTPGEFSMALEHESAYAIWFLVTSTLGTLKCDTSSFFYFALAATSRRGPRSRAEERDGGARHGGALRVESR